MQRQLRKIKNINNNLQDHAKQILFVEKYGTERQAFFLSQKHRKILTRTAIMISQIAINCKKAAPQFKGDKDSRKMFSVWKLLCVEPEKQVVLPTIL
jgi:hypothetical protein